jgi:hypothetical protein
VVPNWTVIYIITTTRSSLVIINSIIMYIHLLEDFYFLQRADDSFGVNLLIG